MLFRSRDQALFTAELTTQDGVSAPSEAPVVTAAPAVLTTPEPAETEKEQAGMPAWEMGLIAIACAAVILISVVGFLEYKTKKKKKKKKRVNTTRKAS